MNGWVLFSLYVLYVRDGIIKYLRMGYGVFIIMIGVILARRSFEISEVAKRRIAYVCTSIIGFSGIMQIWIFMNGFIYLYGIYIIGEIIAITVPLVSVIITTTLVRKLVYKQENRNETICEYMRMFLFITYFTVVIIRIYFLIYGAISDGLYWFSGEGRISFSSFPYTGWISIMTALGMIVFHSKNLPRLMKFISKIIMLVGTVDFLLCTYINANVLFLPNYYSTIVKIGVCVFGIEIVLLIALTMLSWRQREKVEDEDDSTIMGRLYTGGYAGILMTIYGISLIYELFTNEYMLMEGFGFCTLMVVLFYFLVIGIERGRSWKSKEGYCVIAAGVCWLVMKFIEYRSLSLDPRLDDGSGFVNILIFAFAQLMLLLCCYMFCKKRIYKKDSYPF